jgi:hypothetical protein
MSEIRQWSSADRVISFSAMAVALASIVISIWQGIETRQHYRLSVRPRLEIIYQVNDQGFGFVLVNNGLGPALITSRTIYIDDKPMQERRFSGFEALVEKFGYEDRTMYQEAVRSGLMLKPTNQKNIIQFLFKEDDVRRDVYIDFYSRMRFLIE